MYIYKTGHLTIFIYFLVYLSTTKDEFVSITGIVSDDEDEAGKAAGDVLPELSSDDEGPEDMLPPTGKAKNDDEDKAYVTCLTLFLIMTEFALYMI